MAPSLYDVYPRALPVLIANFVDCDGIRSRALIRCVAGYHDGWLAVEAVGAERIEKSSRFSGAYGLLGPWFPGDRIEDGHDDARLNVRVQATSSRWQPPAIRMTGRRTSEKERNMSPPNGSRLSCGRRGPSASSAG